MITRRSFLRVLGIGLVAGPTLVRAALKSEPKVLGWDLAMGGDSTGLTLVKLVEAKKLMDANDVPGDRMFLRLPPSYFNARFNEITDAHALAKGEIQDFMGFTFVRTDLTPKPLSAAEIRKDIAFGRTLDQRISARWHMVRTYAPPTFTWKQDTLVLGVGGDQAQLAELLREVPQITRSMFADVRRAIRDTWTRAWA